MSKAGRSPSDKGITVRHARSCPAGGGGDCACTPTFQAQVWDASVGRRITESFATITGARRWRQDAYAALRAGTLTADRGPTLEEAAEAWLAAARAGIARNRSGDPYKPAAVRGYEQQLRLRVLPKVGHERLRELGLPDLQRLVDRLAGGGLAPATIGATVTPLRAIYRRAAQLGQVHANPTRGLSVPAVSRRQERFATPVQVEAMLARLDATKDRALWATALYAGLRRGELRALRWDDVDLAAGVIHVRRGWDQVEGEISPKSKQGRRKVPVPAVLRDRLVEHRMGADGDRLFVGVRGCYDRGRAAALAAGLAAPTLRECRHGYATVMIAAGVNAKALSEFMGHANIGITLDLYGHLFPGAEDEAAGLLDAFLARQAGAEPAEAPTAAHPERSPS